MLGTFVQTYTHTPKFNQRLVHLKKNDDLQVRNAPLSRFSASSRGKRLGVLRDPHGR